MIISEDILRDIFLECAEFDWSGNRPLERKDIPDWDWITVTHVNRFWRTTALSSPRVWSKPSLVRHSKTRLAAFLERSRKAPLTICTPSMCGTRPVSMMDMGHMCARCRENLLSALKHLKHIRVLDVNLSEYKLFDSQLSIQIEAGVLEELVLTYERYKHHFPKVDLFPLKVPKCFLTLKMPNLKRVALNGFDLPYDTPIMRGLEAFEMDNFPMTKYIHYLQIGQAQWAPSVDELVRMMRMAERLKTLKLFMIRLSPDDNVYGYTRPVEPTQLESLALGHIDVTTYRKLMDTIKFAKTTVFSVEEVMYRNVAEYHDIVQILEHVTQRRECRVLRLGFSRNWSSMHVGHEIYNAENKGRREARRARKKLKTSLHIVQTNDSGNVLDGRHVDYAAIAEMLVNIVRGSYLGQYLNNLVNANRDNKCGRLHLRIGHSFRLDSARWRAHLASFGAVRELRITVEELDNLVSVRRGTRSVEGEPDEEVALADSVVVMDTMLGALEPEVSSVTESSIKGDNKDGDSNQSPGNMNTALVVLPRLTKLTICAPFVADVFDALLCCLKARSEGGTPIKELRISQLRKDKVGDEQSGSTRTKESMDAEIKQYVDSLEYTEEMFGIFDE